MNVKFSKSYEPYPIIVTGLYDAFAGPAVLTVEEARELLTQLGQTVDAYVESQFSYVQVRLMGSTASQRRYTYTDPSGTLAVGDLVEVPVGFRDGAQIAKVVELGKGKGTYTGPLKTVTARLGREEL